MSDAKENLQELSKTWHSPTGWGWFTVVNHTNIGLRYIGTSLIFFFLAGILGLLIRTQLIVPENDFIGNDFYNQIFSMHGITMMFLFAIPIVEGFGVYMVPYMIGTRDLSFPRLSAFSYYVFLIGGFVLWLSMLLDSAPDAGWFNYVPLSLKEFSPGKRIDVYATVITFIEISALAAAVELIVTIFKQKAPGMSLGKMPPFVWSILVMAFMIVFAMPTIIVGSIMLTLDRLLGTGFFDSGVGGDALLWQHLFWWFGHPEVYIIFLPAAGIISTIIPVFCGRPLYGYTAVVLSIVATGVISFGLWVHHMFTTGLPIQADAFFAAASGLIALPSGIQVFSWIATMWGGKPRLNTAFLFSLGFIFMFVLGGLTGIMVASVPFDRQVHDSYFVVAHFHYVLIGGAVFPFFAGLYYWWPKMTGRLLSEKLGQWNFWLTFIGFNVAFFPMHFLGFLGMPRRIYSYPSDLNWDLMNLISTIGSYILGIGFFLFVVNIIYSRKHGQRATNNPWNASTLEWSVSSPAPGYNFSPLPAVRSLDPLWDKDFGVQPAAVGLRTDRREVLVTSVIEGKPQGVIGIPHPTIWPFILALVCGMGFIGIIFNLWWFVFAFFAASVAMTGWFWPKYNWRKEKR